MLRRFQLRKIILNGLHVLFLLQLSLLSFSQDITLETQADLDAFDPSTTIVNGNLLIRPPSNVLNGDIWDLSNLSNLTTVNGNFIIWRNIELINLSGLSNLSYVQGNLEILSNVALVNINGLNSLDSVGGDFNMEELFSLTINENLNNLTKIGDDLRFQNCRSLETINGFSNLETIGGDLVIQNNDDLEEVNAFASLTAISGDLRFWSNDKINDIRNFNSLLEISGSLQFRENILLDYVPAFSNLETIGRTLSFYENHSVENLPMFAKLKTVGENLTIKNNDELIKIDGLDMLESIGASLTIEENIKFRELNDLPSLKNIGLQLKVFDNPMLLQFGGMNALESVGTNLVIEINNELSSISGMNNLISTGGTLTITENENLETISGFQNIDTVGYQLNIAMMPNLTAISGFGNLAIVIDEVYLSQLPKLNALDNFNNLLHIGESLIISSNTKLKNVDGFTSLQTIGDQLYLHINEDLRNVDGFSSLTTINGNLHILGNSSLINLDGLSNLDQIGGQLLIMTCDDLTQIDGLAKLIGIPNQLIIESNELLDNLDGLSNVFYVGQELRINSNDKLTNLDGLENIKSVGGNLSVEFNNDLTDCCGIQPLILDPNGVAGSIQINNNPSECSSVSEVTNSFCGMRINVNTNPPCINGDNGSIQVRVTAYDSSPFSYQWTRQEDSAQGSGISENDFFAIGNLSQGTYNLTVTNPSPDEVTRKNIILKEIDGTVFEIIEIKSTNSSNQMDNGSIHLSISGGTAPYTLTWSGPSSGTQSGLNDDSFDIPFIPHGTYSITIIDSDLNSIEVSIALLDETVPSFPCNEPLDIVILNDVSGSVDATEYKESKTFFVDFLNEANIGLGDDESRASIIEWSGSNSQKIKIPMTGDIVQLQTYKDENRSFSGGTNIHPAMTFGIDYLEDVGRPDVERVLILSTDGTFGQVSPSLLALADEFKAEGYHIITIAFDNAFSSDDTRKFLRNIASVDALAPGAPSYSQLDKNLATKIVKLYLCPIDPGSSATVYFNRDGAIEIDNLEPEKNCPFPEYVDVSFTIEAFRELSIPSETPVTFYLNNPSQSGATKILTWNIPCSIPVGSSETYTVNLPISGPSHIYAVLNDDGNQGAPINFPITEIQEIAYSNNIDDASICLGPNPTLQALKYATSPTPACDTIVNYTINVCNISKLDAFDVTITDEHPTDFILTGSIVNTNGCAIENGSSFDIPANCCVSLNLTYDASNAQFGYYGDQDVILDGPLNQTYYNYLGENSTDEDVSIDGTIDCPSTVIEFSKEVNVNESCDDAFLVYTFTINNEMNIPIQGLSFSDIVPEPSTWVFEPYALEGLSIGTTNIVDNEARFTINKVEANTIARFSMDLSVGKFEMDGQITNTATLENVPDPVNGGFKTLTSNSTNTLITASPEISIADTLIVQLDSDTIALDAIISGIGDIYWTSSGDGFFIDSNNVSTQYILGNGDKENQMVSLFISVETPCSESGKSVFVLLQECNIYIDELIIGDCDDNDTGTDASDDTYPVTFILFAENAGSELFYFAVVKNDTIGPFSYGDQESIQLKADGLDYNITFFDAQYNSCSIDTIVNQTSCSDDCLLDMQSFIVSNCDDNGTTSDNSDDTYTVTFNVSATNHGVDNTYFAKIGEDILGVYSYGAEVVISLPADGMEHIIDYIDSQFEDCILSETVNVASCSNECVLDFDVFNVSECIDNGTTSDNSDDTYTVTFNLSATNPGLDNTYLAIFDEDTLGVYSYGVEVVISIPADGIDHIIDFIDSQFEGCFLSETMNVANCSNECVLGFDVFNVSECDDNGTTSDNSDDTYNVTFNVSASNPGIDNNYLLIIENDTLGTYSYGSENLISLPANGIDVVIYFIDSQDENCKISELVTVASCSDDCNLNLNNFVVSDCDDNDTPAESFDDFYTVEFNVSALNPGSDSSYIVTLENDTIGIFPFDTDQMVTIPADDIADLISFIDSQNESCLLVESVNIASCSDDCILNLDVTYVSDCDDNGTPEDNTDDTYDVYYIFSAYNEGSDSTYIIIIENDTIGPIVYNTDQVITLSSDGVEDFITFIDSNKEHCVWTTSFNFDSCSDECNLILDAFALSDCNDNGTTLDPSDDFYDLVFNVSASNPGTDSSYIVAIGADTLGTYPFSTDQMITIPANVDPQLISFIDSQNEFCILIENVNVESCSDECRLSLDLFEVSECDDNGTTQDNSDDMYSIQFSLSSINPSSSNSYHLLIGNDTIGVFGYDESQSIALNADGLDKEIRFVDSQNDACYLEELVNIEDCSLVCQLSVDFFDISECDDNNTSEDKTDDTYIITFNLSNLTSQTDSLYDVYIGNESLGMFSYGNDHSIILSADGLENEIRFIDLQNEDCNYSELLQLDDCSISKPILEDITIPNIFSPNNDNTNDNWTLEFNNDSEIIRCIIFDRWGNKIYANNVGQEVLWDGKYKGKDVVQGVYVYKIIYSNSTAETISIFGDITVIR